MRSIAYFEQTVNKHPQAVCVKYTIPSPLLTSDRSFSIIIRLEQKEEYREVENLIRESFWNVYRPGAYEHYVMHVLRDDPAFVKELDFVAERDGKLIGQNMFMRAVIEADDGRDLPVLTMGPSASHRR